jgi:GNAT superfamily N-acetyltransferase
MEILIRKAETADAPAITEVLRSLGLFALIDNEAFQSTQERVARHLGLCMSDDSHLVLVAQASSGEVAGYCAVHWLPYLLLAGPEGYVSELFIKEQARGQGLGGRLLETVKEEARSRGCTRLMLLNVRKRESYQRGFYAKHGWEERPEAANFIFRLEV